jgi:hypothetical protein
MGIARSLARYINPAIIFIIVLCVVSRLPQLLSPNLLLDGDECVLALMAKHLYQGKDVSVFFYGQAYGFSLAETSVISIFYFFNGINDHSVKLAMLAIWITGVVFFYKTMVSLTSRGSWLPLFICLIFILSPAWAVWSMRARGGYLTSFALTSVVMWLLFGKNACEKSRLFIATGILLVFIYESQPLWLPGLLPFVVYKMFPRPGRKFLYAAGGLLAAGIPFFFAARASSHYWQQQIFTFSWPAIVANLQQLQLALTEHFQGYYYLWFIIKAPAVCYVYACMFVGLMVLLVAVALYMAFRQPRRQLLFLLSVLPLLGCIGYYAFLETYSPRYLLPLTGYACFSLFLLLRQITVQWWACMFCVVLIVPGILAVYSFKDYRIDYVSKADVYSAIHYAEGTGTYHLFTREGMLQWPIIFYSNEKVIARYTPDTDRYPAYIQAVNNALYNGEKTAIIGTEPVSALPAGKTISTGKIFFYPSPDKELLEKLGYKF